MKLLLISIYIAAISVYNGHKKRLSAGIWCGIVIGMESKWINRKFMFSVWVRNVIWCSMEDGRKLYGEQARMLYYFCVTIINFWKLTCLFSPIGENILLIDLLFCQKKREIIWFQYTFFLLVTISTNNQENMMKINLIIRKWAVIK